ncbi:MAG TPA: DUF637 domain-containing protein [Gammaproteobacteria bacterium]|nr:DUF637 domain-containing protein [Gammaproteobacteria bacterium]
MNIRGTLQNSHGAIIQSVEQSRSFNPLAVSEADGIFLKTPNNIHCTDGGEISAYQGTVEIKPVTSSSRLDDDTQKIKVDDTSRVCGAAATKITGFKQVRFLTPLISNAVEINSDAVQLRRGVYAKNSAKLTQPHGKLRVEDIWRGGDYSVHAEQFDNNNGTLDLQNLTAYADDIALLGNTTVEKELTLYPRRSRKLAESTGDAAHRLRAGRINFHLAEGETITEPYTTLGSLSYRLSAMATQPLVFLANQTSLHGDFSVEAPVPVKMGDATHFVTLTTEQGNVSVKARTFDIEQGGIVSLNNFIEAPGGFTLGRLVEDPTRQVFATVYAHAQSGGSSNLGEHVFRSYQFLGNTITTNQFYHHGHLFVLPMATTNGSFLQIRDSSKILGSFQHWGALKTHNLTIHSPEPSVWEASKTQVAGNCTLTGKFSLKRTTSILTAGYYMCQRTVFQDNIKYSFCNSDPASLIVQGELLGNAAVNLEASVLHATRKSSTLTVNSENFSASCYQKFTSGTLEERQALRDSHQPLSGGFRGYRGQWVGVVRRFPGYPANVACPSNYINDYSGSLPYAVGFLVKTNNFIGAQSTFSAEESYGSTVILPNIQQKEGHCSAPGMLIVAGKNHMALGSPNRYYIAPKAPVRDLMKGGLNAHVTFVNPNLKATLEQNQADKFNFMMRELFWFDDAHAQAFYRDIAAHLFVVSEEGIKRADPRAILSLSPKLLIERVQKETQDVLMRGYIFEGEVIDEHLVQRLHHNATEYLTGMNYQTIKDFLSGKSGLKTAPTKPLIYYEPVMNEQDVEVLQPRLYIPPALIHEVRAQRGGLFKTNLLLVFSENVTPKQLTQLTQHNPAMQSQLIEFFDRNPDERQFLEDHAAAAALALENKADVEQLAMLESKHDDAEHPVSVPEQALAVRDNQRHQASVTFSGHFDVGTFAVLAEGTVSMDAADIKAREAFIASLFGNVELKARVERLGNSENFSDRLHRAHIAVDGILQILAGKDVIFEAAHTQSGLGTYVEALGNILDIPVQLVHQHVQHFYGKKRSGTITNTYTTQVPSMHQTGGNVEMHAGDSAFLYAPEIDAENMTVTAVKKANILPVTECREQTADMAQKKRGRTKTEQSVSAQATAIPAKLNVRKQVTIAGGEEVCIFMNSTALENHFWGEIVHMIQGVNQSCSATQTSSRGMFWQKFCSKMMKQVTYTESNISGSIEIHAKQAILDQVRGKTLGFWEQVECNDAAVTYQILDPQYVHDSKRVQGPSQGLVIVVGLVAGVATFGMGEAIAGSGFVMTTLGITGAGSVAVAAGFSALCAQAAVSLLQNEGNPLKAVESLASVDTAKSVAIAMISAGVMDKISKSLNLPGLGKGKSLLEHLQYNVARASVNAALNMSINHQSPGDALKAGFMDAAVGTAAGAAAQEIGGLRQDGHIGYASHKLLHAALGAVGGAILAGPGGALAGAIGAVVGETVAEAFAPEEPTIESKGAWEDYGRERSRAAQIGNCAGAAAALITGQHVPTAAYYATNATANNFSTSGWRPASLFEDYDADDFEGNDEPKDEADESEFMQELARERRLESMTFKLDRGGMPGNAWEHLAEDRVSVAPSGVPRRGDDNTFMPLWSLETGRDSSIIDTENNTVTPNTSPLDIQPILLWSAPNRFNQASENVFRSRNTAILDAGVTCNAEATNRRIEEEKTGFTDREQRDWTPLKSLSKIKGVKVTHGVDKRGRAYRQDPKTGQFSKSTYARRNEAQKDAGKPQAEYAINVRKVKIFGGTILHELIERQTFLDEETSVGLTAFAYGEATYSAPVTLKKGIVKLEGSVGTGLNIATSKTETPYYDAQMDVNLADARASASMQLDVISREKIAAEGRFSVVLSLGAVKGQITSKEIGFGKVTAQCTVAAEAHGPGLGVSAGGGVDISRTKARASTQFGVVTPAGGLVLQGQCTLKNNIKNEENVALQVPKGLSLSGR